MANIVVMKKILTLLLALVPAISAFAGKIYTDSLYSNALNVNMYYNVYLPSGFQDSDKQYPVVYLLHGLGDDHTGWKEKGHIKTLIDNLIKSGEASEMVIIMPNASNPDGRKGWSGYFNTENWKYEDFFFGELMPTAEKKYRCVGDKEHRAIMGLSMGGGGSTVYCQRYPEYFSSCYAMSAWLDNEPQRVRAKSKEDKTWCVCKAVCDNSALKFLDKADKATIGKLRTVKWFIDCGDDDFLFDLSVELHKKMISLDIKDELRVRDGAHNWEYWHDSLALALPFASRNFGK